MRIGIVCKVIDNYGDAGFSLRLARALASQHHHVTVFHDDQVTFKALCPNQNITNLTLIDATTADFQANKYTGLELLLEPFGTSSEQTKHRFDTVLKKANPETPWLLIDYLSSEDWVEDFHLSSSIAPDTGHASTYFYPGFTAKTGGLIHCDHPVRLRQNSNRNLQSGLRVFVFSYPNAPLIELLEWSENAGLNGKTIKVAVTGKLGLKKQFKCLTLLPFCAQSEFDDLLSQYDVLFVRGEDSFVRAQLAGKPLFWQIYPTEDGAHADKLGGFFERYSAGLGIECKAALWNCWASWNRLENHPDFSLNWTRLQEYWGELNSHALAWRNELLQGPELVKEVLTWRSRQTPTLQEKTDL